MIYGLLKIAGSLGLFLYGMKVMSDGIQKSAGERLQKIMNFMTDNRFAAVFTGFAITCIIQSSSATTVMVVSFVNAGLLNLAQAIGVIMGANIGTTLTGWIVAILGFKVKITAIALPSVGIGIPFLLSKKLGKKDLGEALVGFGILFLGLSFLKDSVPDIKHNPEVLEFLTRYTDLGFLSFLLFVLVGTVVTIIVQSSSAAMAITITLAFAGWIDFPTAAAIVLGENIGTTVTAYLASIGTGITARRAARAHTLFNVIGVIWMAMVFKPFLNLIDLVVPGDIWGPGASELIPAHLAMFHTMFNLTNTLLFIGFVPQMAKVVNLLVRLREGELPTRYRLKYISTALQDTPELNILNAKKELSKMAGIVEEMFARFLYVFNNPHEKLGGEVEELKKKEDYTDQMQEQLSQYLIDCTKENLNETSATNVSAMIRIVDEFESIGDSCFNLILLSQRRYDKKIHLDEAAIQQIEPYTDKVREFLKFIRMHLNEHLSEEELGKALELEEQIDDQRNTLNKAARKRLQKGADVKGELLFIEMVRHIEHIGDYALNVAESLKQIR